MILVKPKFEILAPHQGSHDPWTIFKTIELAGRTCYKSEDKILADSAEKFVNMLINRGHGAMLEHGTVYLQVDNSMGAKAYLLHSKYLNNIYSRCREKVYKDDSNNRGVPYVEYMITTNYRVLVENGWLEDLQYQCEPTEFHEKRITVKFTCDRGVSHEFVRHRVFSFAQESTRYCNYSKDKFGKEITCVLPSWLDERLVGEYQMYKMINLTKNEIKDYCNILGTEEEWFNFQSYISSLCIAENNYFNMLDNGWTPQQARSVLPNSLKTELVMTGTIEQWKGFFKLRCDKAAHPQARELAIPLRDEFIKRKWICID